MWKCNRCGAENSDNFRFCGMCGKPCESDSQKQSSQYGIGNQQQSSQYSTGGQQSVRQNRNSDEVTVSRKALIIGIVVVAVAIVAVLILIMSGGSQSETYSTSAASTTYADYFVGDSLFFGTYERDNDRSNGKERIEWIVLDKSGSQLLLISKYGLDAMPFSYPASGITWENCSIREWLNDDFLNTAFTAEEQRAICLTTVQTNEVGRLIKDGVLMTQDKVFLLDVRETVKYMPSAADRKCRPTTYANQHGAVTWNGTGCCDWWLRSISDNWTKSSPYISELGSAGEFRDCLASEKYPAVRPVIWLDTDVCNGLAYVADAADMSSPTKIEYYDGSLTHTYEIILGDVTFKEAKAQCEALGGHLATITSRDEWNVVSQIISDAVWLGASRDSGSWVWVTGEAWTIDIWASGEPNMFESAPGVYEKYLGVYFPELEWNDFINDPPPRGAYGYICEWD